MPQTREVPPFVPGVAKPEVAKPKDAKAAEHMVVMTVRVAPRTRDALRLFLRHDDQLKFSSVSHVVQTAIDEFLVRHK